MHVLTTVVGQRTEHWIDLLTTLIDQTGIELTLCAADVSPLAAQSLAELDRGRERFHFHHLPHVLGEGRTGHMASALFRPGSLRTLRQVRPDVLHVIGEAAYLSTFQALHLRNRHWPTTPITLYAAQNTMMRLPFPFPSLEQYAYRTVAHAFPITPAALELLRVKGYQGPASIVPLGVDTTAFQPTPAVGSRPFSVGFVGRLEPHKGIRDLLHGSELLDCDLIVVGEGSLRKEVERAAARRPGRIRLYSWLDHGELPSILARMDALVLPSLEVVQRNVVPWIGIPLREQFGRVLVEAMACGVPVVGSDVGEIPYVVESAGLIYPAGEVSAMACRLAQIRDDPDLARRLGATGRSRAEKQFAWAEIAKTMHHTWQELAVTAERLNGHHRQRYVINDKRPDLVRFVQPDEGKAL
ncbi:glycosyltransferase family 4 protein [Saccharopolyspora mangrovi]|uniref:Glycosyltransferase family 4 protein n=1 Tax=Saccharopolyspora mangrovi TaxID=3082379 RepID=A0ABU6AEM4_9PSEU|nr:glycosyltransferase family 4 protein [Saccharopolyspora sp. S2-29]MEB3369997.1 glycosyltransferase family 4 protein [Saccharopolyspora sp. S2-29]